MDTPAKQYRPILMAVLLLASIVLCACSNTANGISAANPASPASPATYAVTYNGNGATGGAAPTDSIAYAEGQSVTVPGNTGNIVKSGSSFTGWNTAADGSGTTYTQGQTFSMGSANVTLYARWTTNPTYTVAYDSNGAAGGAVPTDGTNYENGQTVTVLGNTGNIVKSGNSFTGWNTTADGSGTTYTQGQTFSMGSANVTLYAKWTTNPTYAVTFDGDGATGGAVPMDSTNYEYGQTVTVLGNTGNLVKTGGEFYGWSTAADGNGTVYIPGQTFTMGSANVSFYAKWTMNPTYAVTYNGNGGTGGIVPIDSTNYENGKTVTVLGNTGNLVKTGCELYGWNTIADRSGTNYVAGRTFTMKSANVPLYAVWSSWKVVGAAGFSASDAANTSLAIDSSGTPYVAYTDGAYNNKASVMKYNGSTWVQAGSAGFSAGITQYISLAIDSSGTPYVAYSDGANNNKTSVMKYNGSAWVQVGSAGFSAGETQYISLAIDSSGTPYVAYQDHAYEYKVSVMKYTGSAWVQVGSAGFSEDYSEAAYVSLAIDSSGIPYVAYSNFGNMRASVMKYAGSAWVQVGSEGFAGARCNSLVIDSSGTPYIAYRDYENGQKLSVKKYNGSVWMQVGAEGFSVSVVNYTSLAIDSNGTLYVAYQDDGNENRACVMKNAGNDWMSVGFSGFSTRDAKYTSLAIDSSGALYVAYDDSGNSCKATVMKFEP